MTQPSTADSDIDRAVPEVDDYVKLTFDGDESPIKGRVTEVDENTEAIPEVDMLFTVDNGESGTHIVYAEGVTEDTGEEESNVTRSGPTIGNPQTLGDNADWRKLQ